MRKLKMFIISLALIFGAVGLAPLAVASADTPQSTVCQTLGSNSDCSKQPANGVSVNNLVTVVVNVLSVIIGIIAVIMIIIGGLRYITSNGDSNNISSAKNTILYAIIGLVIVAMAQFIVQFVVAKTTAPSCGSKQQLNDKTNTCVPKKGWTGSNYAVTLQDYLLN